MTKSCFLNAELESAEAKVEEIKQKIQEENDSKPSRLRQAEAYLNARGGYGVEYNTGKTALVVDVRNSTFGEIQHCLDEFNLTIYNIYNKSDTMGTFCSVVVNEK